MERDTKADQLPANDSNCGWLSGLPPRASHPPLRGEQRADWVVVGGGFSGMAAARQLAAVRPHDRIVLIDACRIGEGASARNSGFLVDVTLNEGAGVASDLSVLREKYELNLLATAELRGLVTEGGIDCDWDPRGKIYGARHERYVPRLERFDALLGELGVARDRLDGGALREITGTDFYTSAVRTKASVLLHPGKLARGLHDNLPPQIEPFEDSPVLSWTRVEGGYRLSTRAGRVTAPQVVVTVNGFMPALGIETARSFPLVLSGSMSRPLTDAEHQAIGAPNPFGVLSADAMGATVRLTGDRRLLVRSTCDVPGRMGMRPRELEARRRQHQASLARRYPALPGSVFENTWSGIVSISSNGHHVFGTVADGLHVAGCYNANGLGLTHLLGKEIANLATHQNSNALGLIARRSRPSRLPPQPFLGWGVRLRVAADRFRARSER